MNRQLVRELTEMARRQMSAMINPDACSFAVDPAPRPKWVTGERLEFVSNLGVRLISRCQYHARRKDGFIGIGFPDCACSTAALGGEQAEAFLRQRGVEVPDWRNAVLSPPQRYPEVPAKRALHAELKRFKDTLWRSHNGAAGLAWCRVYDKEIVTWNKLVSPPPMVAKATYERAVVLVADWQRHYEEFLKKRWGSEYWAESEGLHSPEFLAGCEALLTQVLAGPQCSADTQ